MATVGEFTKRFRLDCNEFHTALKRVKGAGRMKIQGVFVFQLGYWLTPGSNTPDSFLNHGGDVEKISIVNKHVFISFKDKSFITVDQSNCLVKWDGVNPTDGQD